MAHDLQDEIAKVIAAAGSEPDGAGNAVRDAIARLPVAAFLADDHGKLVAANGAAESLTEYSSAELLRLSVPEITGSADQNTFQPLWRAFIAMGEQRGTYELITKRGRPVTVEYLAATIAPGLHLSVMRPFTLGSGRR